MLFSLAIISSRPPLVCSVGAAAGADFALLGWLVGRRVVIVFIIFFIAWRGEEIGDGGLLCSSWIDGRVGVVDEVHAGALEVVDDCAGDENCGDMRSEFLDQVRDGVFKEVPVDVLGMEAVGVEYPKVCV